MKKNKQINVLSIIGTRPEAIKMAPVIKALQAKESIFTSIVCATGQHRMMLDQELDLFGIEPDYDLDLMKHNQGLCELTSRLFNSLNEVVLEVKPDWILAQGDTSTVLVSSLVAYYCNVSFGHIEAGLRTSNLKNPFPEELNRRVADMVSTVCFAPTEWAKQNLCREGIKEKNIYVTGNTVIDALIEIASRRFLWNESPLRNVPESKRLVLITAHRRESYGEPLREICMAVSELADAFRDDGYHFVYPVHLSPNVREPINEILRGISNVHLMEPLDYLTFVHLMKASYLILTDSGGIQEEAPSLGIPVLVMRDTTERPEGIEAGVVRVVGTRKKRIFKAAAELMSNEKAHEQMARRTNPYGDGLAASRIITVLESFLDR